MNQKEVREKHLRVDVDGINHDDTNDFDTTIFIGNLPFVTNEEDLRQHFQGCAREALLTNHDENA